MSRAPTLIINEENTFNEENMCDTPPQRELGIVSSNNL